ncbi:hypothetical protein Nocox_35625 [Nonomuraea coxensis DSM 45129]|uniref:Uncharacterized protein n=1 Tax=Nonomuraea coxensis DSM 45129 TaxID=1122611 RepID=A0ABX8UD92_9ACTN|nr:hypothetical protein [Nonomuraea coxensis]QYC44684.1 hypothetical protein Nocox_35625 [Nonomuraea coxensis DSM 45129]
MTADQAPADATAELAQQVSDGLLDLGEYYADVSRHAAQLVADERARST